MYCVMRASAPSRYENAFCGGPVRAHLRVMTTFAQLFAPAHKIPKNWRCPTCPTTRYAYVLGLVHWRRLGGWQAAGASLDRCVPTRSLLACAMGRAVVFSVALLQESLRKKSQE